MSLSDELQLTLLGKPEIVRGAGPVTSFVYKKSQALLYYLAVTGCPHTREALAGLLWGETTEANARAGLRKSLADLRKLLGAHVLISRHHVAFDRERPYWLDVEVFERGGEIVAAWNRDGVLTDEDAVTLAAAVDLYRGDLMVGFYVHRAPGFEYWCTLQRERLRLMVLRMLHTLADHYTARGAYAQAIAYVGRVLALEPGQEKAHRQMMSLLALTGQQGAALRQYNACRRALAEAWGVEPEEETESLYERIRDRGELDAHAPSPRHSLPTSLTSLVGRETELAEIVTRLQDPACRLLTLVGPGGSGKTHLALEIANLLVRARRLANVFYDGVYWVSLASLDSTRAIVPAMAQGLRFLFHAESDPRRQLLDYVRQKSLLLVIDNAEHLLASSRQSSFPDDEKQEGIEDLLSDVLETASSVKILVTSRARLNLRYEHLFPITGIEVPPFVSPKDGKGARGEGQYGAVQLFLQSARRAQPGFELTDDDLADVARICRQVAGMPLGILLAASWTRLLSLAEIAAHLSDGMADGIKTGQALDLLETDWRDVPARQRSMRAVFDHSWNLLTEREQAVLAALSVFRGGFTYKAGRQVSGASLRELMALMDQSLLHRTAAGRYEMHELLGQYTGEKLQAVPGAAKMTRDRHSAYFAAALQRWTVDLKSARQQEALAEMDVEITNARVAWDWMLNQGDLPQIDRTMEGLCLFYEWRNRYQEGESACRAVAQILVSDPLDLDWEKGMAERMLARVLAWQSVFSYVEHARQLLRESMALLESAERAGQDTRSEKAFTLLRMASSAMADKQLHEQNLALYQMLGDRWGAANVLEHMGWLAWNSAVYDEAKRLYEQSLDIYQALGDQRGIANSSQWVGTIALFQGQLEGERLVREGLAIHQEIGDRARMAEGFYFAGMGLMSLGEYTEAHVLLEKSVATYTDLGIRNHTAAMFLGSAKIHLGQYKEGHIRGQITLDAAQEFDDLAAIGFAFIVLGWVALVGEAYTEAKSMFQEGIDACQEIEQRDVSSWGFAFLGYAKRGAGQLAQAGQHFFQALRIATEIQSFVAFMFALPGMALLLADLGHEEQAIELYSLASRYPMVSNSRWFADVVGRPIAVVAATLPPDIVAAAEERGQARDLEATIAELLAELEGDFFPDK